MFVPPGWTHSNGSADDWPKVKFVANTPDDHLVDAANPDLPLHNRASEDCQIGNGCSFLIGLELREPAVGDAISGLERHDALAEQAEVRGVNDTIYWRNRPIDSITRRDVNDLLDKLVEGGLSVQANRVLAYVRKLFNWCIERGILDTSPAFQVKPPAAEQPRERDLKADEIATLWPAFASLGEPFGPYMQILLILGQRRNEVASMRWQDIDLERGEWTFPRELTKAKRTHIIPLPHMAVDILKTIQPVSYRPSAGRPPIASDFVFTTTGETPISGFGRVKARIDKAAAEARKQEERETVAPWCLHDLRRTAATRMAELGVPVEHIGRVLNHAPRGITATVYDKHTYIPEKRRALDVWADYLKSIVAPEDGGNVVKLRG